MMWTFSNYNIVSIVHQIQAIIYTNFMKYRLKLIHFYGSILALKILTDTNTRAFF